MIVKFSAKSYNTSLKGSVSAFPFSAATGNNKEKTNLKGWRITGLDIVLFAGSLAFFIFRFQPP
jgi:predicted branched-subunit amino acid permease